MRPELVSLLSCLHRSTALILSVLTLFMVAEHSAIVASVAQRTSFSAKAKTIAPFVVAAFLASWFAIAILVGDGANFPIPTESRQAASGSVALIPVVIAVIALFASKNLRAINGNTQRLADRHSNLPLRRHHVCPSLSYAWNTAGRICLSRKHWGRINWTVRARCGGNGRAKSASCFQVGGSVESFWYARFDRCSRDRAPFSGAGSQYLPSFARAVVPRTTAGNPHPHSVAQKSSCCQIGHACDGVI